MGFNIGILVGGGLAGIIMRYNFELKVVTHNYTRQTSTNKNTNIETHRIIRSNNFLKMFFN